MYKTDPMYVTDQPYFYNFVCKISTELSPEELLTVIKEIEKIWKRYDFYQ